MDTMVGFDVAKNTVVAAMIGSNYQILVAPVTLRNIDHNLRSWLRTQQQQYPRLAVCCESTSYYHYQIIRLCADLGICCRVLNPIVTKQATKATIRGKKTDASDALLIAQLGLRAEGIITTAIATESKALLRASDKLVTMRQALRLVHTSLHERGVLLPAEVNTAFSDLLMGLQATSTSLRQAAVSQTSEDTCKLLMSIPGVGQYLAAVLVAEISDVARFASANQLIAFAGFDPRVRQSGLSLHRNTHLTKRGSPSLRRAVFIAGNVARRYDPVLAAYYQRKRREGRTHTEAMMPISRRILTRVYAVWKRHEPYELRDDA